MSCILSNVMTIGISEENIFTGSSSAADPILDLIVYGAIAAIYLAIIATVYIFNSIGLSKMLRAVGYKKPWLAWIPFANIYALGALADHYDNGLPRTNYAKKLLLQSIIFYVLIATMFFVALPAVVTAQGGGEISNSTLIAVYTLYIPVLIFAIQLFVNTKIAEWRIYRMFHPELSLLYVILSICISSYISSILFFAICRRKPQNVRGNDEEPKNPYIYE